VGPDLATVVTGAAFRIGEKIVSGSHFLEILIEPALAGVEIGMKLLCELAIGALDIVIRRAAWDAEHRVGVSHLSHFASNGASQQRLSLPGLRLKALNGGIILR